MPNIAAVLKDEISRIARKEIRSETTSLKKASSQYRRDITNEIKSMLQQQGVMTRRDERIKNTEAYLFHHGKRWNKPYSENRIRQIFRVLSARVHEMIHFRWYRQLWPASSA